MKNENTSGGKASTVVSDCNRYGRRNIENIAKKIFNMKAEML